MVLLPFVMEKIQKPSNFKVDHNLHHLIIYKHRNLMHKLDNHIKLLALFFILVSLDLIPFDNDFG
jgi:hypothetical protein